MAPRKRVGLELGNNAPVIIEPSGDWKTAAVEDQGRRLQPRRPVVHLDATGLRAPLDPRRLRRRLVDQVGALVVGDPLDDATDVSALISPGDTERVSAWIDEAVGRRGDASRSAATVDGRLLEPTVLTGVLPDMKVCTEEVFGPVVGVAAYDDARRGARPRQRHAVRPAGGDLHQRARHRAARAARTLDFGGVLVNEVPTWRTDQMPYGGVRDSGNTREGPAYAVREMTEERLVVIQAGDRSNNPPRWWTVDEANAALPRVTDVVERASGAAEELSPRTGAVAGEARGNGHSPPGDEASVSRTR